MDQTYLQTMRTVEAEFGHGWYVCNFLLSSLKLTCFECSSTVYTLALLSIVNYIFTLFQTKSYRLFNADVNAPVASKSAYRVKVDASPATSTPMRIFSSLIPPSSSRAHTPDDSVQEVWEIPVWDPSPVCLRTSILFSPGHVLVVWLTLPYSQSDPRPSVTIASTLGLCLLLSLQGHFLQTKFSQQSKDSSAIYKEVSKEYDSKFVQPNAQKHPVRDVGVQFPHPSPQWDARKGGWEAIPEVVSGSPYNSPKGFHTKANPAYKSYFDPKNSEPAGSHSISRPVTTPYTSNNYPPSSVANFDHSSPIRQIPAVKPQYRSTGTGDGGSLGVYTHAASPLRKAASSNILRQGNANDARRREKSPLKRSSMPAVGLNQRLSNSREETNRRINEYY